MPWIKQELCTGCRTCMDVCPVHAIAVGTGGVAAIDEAACIRCGQCHGACPQNAVRHDGERIPQEIAENLRWVLRLLRHFKEPKEQSAFMERMERFFNKQKKVSEQTLAAIHAAKAHLTVGGAPGFVLPGGGITFMVDVERVQEGSFYWTPTPATICPLEYTMELKDYEEMGGHLEAMKPFDAREPE